MIQKQSSLDYVNAQVALIEKASYLSSSPNGVRYVWDSASSSQASRHAVTVLGSMPFKPVRPTNPVPDEMDDITRIVADRSGSLVIGITGKGGPHCRRPINWLSSYTRARIRVAWIKTPSGFEEETGFPTDGASWGARGEWTSQCDTSKESGTLLIRFD